MTICLFNTLFKKDMDFKENYTTDFLCLLASMVSLFQARDLFHGINCCRQHQGHQIKHAMRERHLDEVVEKLPSHATRF